MFFHGLEDWRRGRVEWGEGGEGVGRGGTEGGGESSPGCWLS